jgi:hypothetical protein
MVYGTSLLKWSSTASKSFNGKIKKEIKLCVPFSEERCRECVSWKRKTKQITRFLSEETKLHVFLEKEVQSQTLSFTYSGNLKHCISCFDKLGFPIS